MYRDLYANGRVFILYIIAQWTGQKLSDSREIETFVISILCGNPDDGDKLKRTYEQINIKWFYLSYERGTVGFMGFFNIGHFVLAPMR